MKFKIFPVVLLVLAAAAAPLQGQDKKADPIGNWTWTSPGGNGGEVKSKLDLKKEGEKLAGKVEATLPDDQIITSAVEEITVKDDEIAFKLTPEFNGAKLILKYKGKIEGDTIKGTIEYDFGGQTGSVEWNATRAKAKPAAQPK